MSTEDKKTPSIKAIWQMTKQMMADKLTSDEISIPNPVAKVRDVMEDRDSKKPESVKKAKTRVQTAEAALKLAKKGEKVWGCWRNQTEEMRALVTMGVEAHVFSPETVELIEKMASEYEALMVLAMQDYDDLVSEVK